MSFSTHYKRLARISLLVPCLLLIQPTQAKADSDLIEIVSLSVFTAVFSTAIIKLYEYMGIYHDPNCCIDCKAPLDNNYNNLSQTALEK